MDKDFDQMFQDQMHCCDDKNTRVFLTKGEHDQYMSENDNIMLETDDTLSWEMEEFKKGYRNAIIQFQKKKKPQEHKGVYRTASEKPHQGASGRHPSTI